MQVDIWSDVVCPWCAVGRARFLTALEHFEHRDDVAVRWRSFELDPAAPAVVTGSYVERLAGKYGTSVDEAQAMIDRMTDQAAAEGLTFRFDIARPGNTFDAHRVLHLAADRGLQHEAKARFLEAYHGQGEAIGDHATLRRLATDAGLDDGAVAEVLASDAYAEAVRGDERQATQYGISGVPFFVFDGRIGVSGAQPAAMLTSALQQAWQTRAPLAMVGATGGSTAGRQTATTTGDHDHTGACADGRCSV